MVATGSQSERRSVRRVVGSVAGGLLLLALLSSCSVQDAFYFGWPKGGITPQSQRMFDLWIGSTVAALTWNNRHCSESPDCWLTS